MDADAIIIGAGAAGIAAGRALADAGRRVIVLEARDRIGGRIWTDHAFWRVPVERGAEFIHGAKVVTWKWIDRLGMATLAVDRWAGRRILDDSGVLVGSEALERPDLRPLQTLEEDLAAYAGPEGSFADWIAARGLSPLAAHIADIRLAHSACATPADLSLRALAAELRGGYDDGGDFRILAGYDRLLEAIAAGLDIRLNTPVEAIQWNEHTVTIGTPHQQWRAPAAIITLPLAILQAGAVRFDPPLPLEKARAIEQLSMAPAMKLVLRFDQQFWDETLTFLSLRDPAPVWWTVRPNEPLLTAFLTGPRAARLSAQGAEGALESGLGSLAAAFGAEPRRRLAAWQVVDWWADPWARGGYSATPPGASAARRALAAPCGALQFAGEATVCDSNPATVHGALQSGKRAATALLA